MDKLIVYLANLTHINDNTAAIEGIPLNIGYLAAYLKKLFAAQVEIRLFNVYSALKEAVENRPPHILAAGNYSWNSRLSYHALSFYKRRYPAIITVMGGPAFPCTAEGMRDFLLKRKLLDFYISGEGEAAFAGFIRACLAEGPDIDKIRSGELRGCHYLAGDELVSCPPQDRIKDLDVIPSPYLGGFLDEFLNRAFVPIVQSNRGCPFSCAYCCISTDYYKRVSFFSVARVREELEYIARRVKVPSVYMHDSNFGMFEQDFQICRHFREIKEKYGWPDFISAATAKNPGSEVLKCVEPVNSCLTFSLSVQSTNEEVLKNIGRENISLKGIWDLQQRLKALGAESLSEFILPLPGETFDSHLQGLKAAMASMVDSIWPYTTMLLEGSPLCDEKVFDRFRMLTKYRVVPRGFGRYGGTNVVEVERVCVATRDLSFKEYLFLRGFHFIVFSYYNAGMFKELIYYLRNAGVEIYDFCYALLSNMDAAPARIKEIFESFLSDTEKELWDSEEDIARYYRQDSNFNKLLAQDEGANLVQKYQGLILGGHFEVFLRYAVRVAGDLFRERNVEYDTQALEDIASYIVNSRSRILDILEEDIRVCLEYDVHTWRQEGFSKPIAEYRRKTKIRFSQTEKQKDIIRNYCRLHGSTAQGKGKILTRHNPETPFREISLMN